MTPGTDPELDALFQRTCRGGGAIRRRTPRLPSRGERFVAACAGLWVVGEAWQRSWILGAFLSLVLAALILVSLRASRRQVTS